MRSVAGEETTLLVAVDGGATGTRVRLADMAGATLGEGTAGPASLTLGITQAATNVGAAYAAARAAAGDGAPAHARIRLAAGLAGSRGAAAAAAFRAADPIGCAEMTVVTDGYASLLGAHAGAPGIVLAVGTGVTGYALHAGGAVCQASGCGFPLGDEGGGAWIGHRAAQALTWAFDGRGPAEGCLLADLRDAVGADLVAVETWALDAGPTAYAALAPLVVAAAADGDAVAGRIMTEAGGELDRVIAAVEAPDAALPIALLGGLGPSVAPRLSGGVQRRLVAAQGGPLDGLVALLRDSACTAEA